MYCYGYRYGEVPLPKLGLVKEDATWEINEGQDLAYRPPALVDMGPHVLGVAIPTPDQTDRDTMIAGSRKRIAASPPTPEESLLQELTDFVDRWCVKYLTPLRPDSDTSVESWLEASKYPEWRKKQLLNKWQNVRSIWDKRMYLRCKSFMKRESYAAPEWKHARGIFSRSDEYKCAVGPIFHLIEKELFSTCPAFVKYVPVAERAKYIMERIHREGATYIATDYKSFESLFVRRLMEACEFRLYSHMVQLLPEARDFDRHMDEVLGGKNVCTFKWFVLRVIATRMSGEMCTSLGNGFANLMLLLFASEKAGCEVIPCIEGDDGVARIEKGPPPTAEFFERLGLRIELVKHDDLETASFCGLIFDVEDLKNVADPRKIFAAFAWCENRYANARGTILKQLLRCKAMSLAYQYPGCPIVSALANYGLRVTEGVRVSKRLLDGYLRNLWNWSEETCETFSTLILGEEKLRSQTARAADLAALLATRVGLRTRNLVEKVFSITVGQQLQIEEYLNKKTDMKPLNLPVLEFPANWYLYYQMYCLPVLTGGRTSYPGPLWVKRADWSPEW